MRRIFKIFILVFQLCTVSLFAQEYLPISKGELVKHSHYTLSYIENYEQAEWVCYRLSLDMINGTETRANNFRSDSKVSTGSAEISDYYKSGYDRGHLVPAYDMRMSKKAMSETFLLSNVSPQTPSFNRDCWFQLEKLVRKWCIEERELIVVVGGVFKDLKGTIGVNKVTIPGYYYKIIYAPLSKKMIGFVLPNKKTNDKLSSFVVKVNLIEALTDIDFFPELEDSLEEHLESSLLLDGWEFIPSKWNKSRTKKVVSKNTVQCSSLAKSTGKRCKNRTKNTNGYCYVHQSSASNYKKEKLTNYIGRCNATTKKGTRCKRKAASKRRYCWQH